MGSKLLTLGLGSLLALMLCYALLQYSGDREPRFHLKTAIGPAAPECRNFTPVHPREIAPASRNVFFVESSCALLSEQPAPDGVKLNPRQACAIYSAAHMNRERKIYLVHTCPLEESYYNRSSKCTQRILDLDNVRVVDYSGGVEGWLEDTPLEGLHSSLALSSYPVEHVADALRMLLLWKYGGSYLDLDIVDIRSLDGLGDNWAGAEAGDTVANGIINFSPQGQGHAIVSQVLKEMNETYNPAGWASNGPELLTSVLRKMCAIPEGKDLQTVGLLKECNFTILPASYFYAIPYGNWRAYFDETSLESVMTAANNSYMIHVWNKLSKGEQVRVGSLQPYGLYAAEYCTPVFFSAGDDF